MKRSRFFGRLSADLLLAVALLAGLAFAACSSDPPGDDILTEEGASIQEFNPDYEEITHFGFRIKASTAATVSTSPDTGQIAEYAVSRKDSAPDTGWQYGLQFTGLDANTEYHVWARSGARLTATTNYTHGTAVMGERTIMTGVGAEGLLNTLNALTAGAAALADDGAVVLTGKVTLTKALEIEQGVALLIDNAAAEIDAKSFAISGAGQLEVSKGTLKAESGKIGVDAVFKPAAKYVRVSGTPQVSETLIGAGGNIELETSPSSDNAISLRKSGSGYEYSIAGSAAVKTGKTFTLEAQDLLCAEEDAVLTVIGTLLVKSGGKVNIDGTIDIGAGTLTGSCASVTLAGGGTLIVPSGSDETALNETIADIKKINRGTGTEYSGNVVIKLTQAFYTAAVTEFIAVDPGANDNAVPYTIRGMGKDITADLTNTAIPKLGVGMWLANNNVTLEDVSFKIAAAAEGLVPTLPWTINNDGEVTDFYGVAVLLARTEDGDLLGGSKNVTVQNCAVAITGGSDGETYTGGIWVYGTPSGIDILDNTVTVTGKEGNAVQALAFDEWGDNIKVKNNKLTAKYAVKPDLEDLDENDFYARPASAFYIGRFYHKPAAGAYRYTAGDISGNSLSYSLQNGSVFSFYVCAYPRPLPVSENGSRKGVAAMGNKKFGNPTTTWILDNPAAGDYHRLVVGDLIDNCKAIGDGSATKNGFGAVLMYVSYKEPDNIYDFNIETYKIASGKLANIGICSLPIKNGDYTIDEDEDIIDTNVTVKTNGTTTPGANGHFRYWQ